MRGAFMTPVRNWLGYSYPLGATWMDNGVNFALFSDHATGVELCLFENREATEENIRVPIVNVPIRSGTCFCPMRVRDNCTVSALPVRTIPNTACGLTVRNSCSTPTPKLSPEK